MILSCDCICISFLFSSSCLFSPLSNFIHKEKKSDSNFRRDNYCDHEIDSPASQSYTHGKIVSHDMRCRRNKQNKIRQKKQEKNNNMVKGIVHLHDFILFLHLFILLYLPIFSRFKWKILFHSGTTITRRQVPIKITRFCMDFMCDALDKMANDVKKVK